MRRTAIAVSALAALTLSLAAPAAFAGSPYPFPPPDAHCDPGRGPAGTPLDCVGHNWLPNSEVQIFFDMTVKSGGGGTASVGMSLASLFAPSSAVLIATAHTNANGTFHRGTHVPNTAAPGLHDIIFEGSDLGGDPATVFDDFFVTTSGGGGGGGGVEGGGVAFTGTNVSLGLLILGALVIAGLGLVVAGRRRRAHAKH
jgi:hypothetical protein